MYKGGVKRGVLIAFLQICIRSCVITGPGTNMSVIYGPSFTRRTPYFMYYPCFLWFKCSYFCKLISLRLNDKGKVRITRFFWTRQSGRIIWTLWGLFTLKSRWLYIIRWVCLHHLNSKGICYLFKLFLIVYSFRWIAMLGWKAVP